MEPRGESPAMHAHQTQLTTKAHYEVYESLKGDSRRMEPNELPELYSRREIRCCTAAHRLRTVKHASLAPSPSAFRPFCKAGSKARDVNLRK